MRKKIQFFTILTIFVAILVPGIISAVSPPSIPLLVYGNVTIDGEPASVSTKISAEIDNIEVAIAILIDKGKYLIKVPDGEDNEGKMITFKINGLANSSQLQSVNIAITPSINFNLAVTTTRSCSIANGQGTQVWQENTWQNCTVQSCNSGYHQSENSCVVDSSESGSGGGGGSTGGGGGSYTPPATTPSSATQGDINNDNKIDKYDFALMMSAWGKTGTNSSDLNGDNKVDKYDFALLMANWKVE